MTILHQFIEALYGAIKAFIQLFNESFQTWCPIHSKLINPSSNSLTSSTATASKPVHTIHSYNLDDLLSDHEPEPLKNHSVLSSIKTHTTDDLTTEARKSE